MTQGQVELYGFASPLKCVLDTAHPSVWAQTIDLFFASFYRFFFCINPIMFHILGHSDMCFTVISPILILMIPRCSNHSCSHSVIIATLIIILFRYPFIHNVCIVTIYIYIYSSILVIPCKRVCINPLSIIYYSLIMIILPIPESIEDYLFYSLTMIIFPEALKTVLCCND